jgi:hypothetical protein
MGNSRTLRSRLILSGLAICVGLLSPLGATGLRAQEAARSEKAASGRESPGAEATGSDGAEAGERERAKGVNAGERKATGDNATEDPPARSGWSASPIVSYAPETHLGLGAFGVHFFRLGEAPIESRPSSMAVVALYTTRRQFIGELIPELYWNDERWHLWSKLDYRHYPNKLWGVGNDLPDENEEGYLETGPRWQIWLRDILVYSFYLEGRIDAQHMKISRTEEGGLLDTAAVPGHRGGNTTGLGLTAGWDSRDHALVPRRGAFHELSLMTWQRVLGSRYDFCRFEVNLRQYLPVTRSHTLALQLYGEFLTGEPPFYRMALLGGQYLLRGYFEGRYRDNDLVAAQAEYRFPLFWRISAVAFAAAGDVSDRLENFGLGHLKWAAGGGLRLMLSRDEKLNLRVDGAGGIGTFGIYATAKEAF